MAGTGPRQDFPHPCISRHLRTELMKVTGSCRNHSREKLQLMQECKLIATMNNSRMPWDQFQWRGIRVARIGPVRQEIRQWLLNLSFGKAQWVVSMCVSVLLQLGISSSAWGPRCNWDHNWDHNSRKFWMCCWGPGCKCPRIMAEFSSPQVCLSHSVDPSITEYIVQNPDSNEEFHLFLSLGSCSIIPVTKANRDFFISLSRELANSNLYI
jgi:hypothetical protein